MGQHTKDTYTKIYCTVYNVDIINNKVTVKMYLPDCEIIRVLKDNLGLQLQELNLTYKGAEFYFICWSDGFKQMDVKIVPYKLTKIGKDKLDKMYKNIEKLVSNT